MEVLDLKGSVHFAPDRHVYRSLAETPRSSISVVGWEAGQVSPIHSHPDADEIYHVLEGEGLFDDGRRRVNLGPGATVVFPAGEVHRVEAVTRMVLYRVQAGVDRHPEPVPDWPRGSCPPALAHPDADAGTAGRWKEAGSWPGRS